MNQLLAPNGGGGSEGLKYKYTTNNKFDDGDGTGARYATGYGRGDGVNDDCRFTFVHLCTLIAITTEVPS